MTLTKVMSSLDVLGLQSLPLKALIRKYLNVLSEDRFLGLLVPYM